MSPWIFPSCVRVALWPCAFGILALSSCGRRVAEPPPSQEPPAPPRTTAASPAPGPSATPALAVSATTTAWPEGYRFAVIGDYGDGSAEARRVSDLVHSFHPELVLTVGDNNYPAGAAETIDRNIGQFYSDFIGSYHGRYGKGAPENRFFPALGNHDWYTDDAEPYLDYFTLPGNERYYAFSRGPLDFFALDSDPHEPDGTNAESKQAAWLKAETAKAHGAWQIAYMHHPPYSSGPHGSTLETEWPYHAFGIDVVLAGHDHTYERAVVDGVTFLVNGMGGAHEYGFGAPVPGSQFRYQEKHGAQLAVATKDELRITFVNVDGAHIDEVVLHHEH